MCMLYVVYKVLSQDSSRPYIFQTVTVAADLIVTSCPLFTSFPGFGGSCCSVSWCWWQKARWAAETGDSVEVASPVPVPKNEPYGLESDNLSLQPTMA